MQYCELIIKEGTNGRAIPSDIPFVPACLRASVPIRSDNQAIHTIMPMIAAWDWH